MRIMAGAPYPIANFLTPMPNATQNRTKQPLQSSISAQSPSRLTKRRNHLRPKILRTLNKPYNNPLPPHQPPKNPVIPIEPIEPLTEPTTQDSQDPESDIADYDKIIEESSSSIDADEGKFREVQVGTSSKVGLVGSTIRTFLGFGLFLFGLVVLRTIWVVWVVGSDEKERVLGNEHQYRSLTSEGKYRNLSLRLNGKDVGGKLGIRNEGFVYVDDRGLQEKIDEIRKMAREAREMESKNLEATNGGLDEAGDGDEEDEGDGAGADRSDGILQEIDGSLSKLRKGLDPRWEKLPSLTANLANESSGARERRKKESLNGIDRDKTLMFKKKNKFRSHTIPQRDKPNGFSGSENGGGLRGRYRKAESSDGDLKRVSEDHNGRMKPEETVIENGKPGGVQDSASGKYLDEEAKEREYGNLETEDSRRITNEFQDKNSYKGQSATHINGRSRASQRRSRSSIDRGKDKQLNGQSDLWWLNLPYVLAILMQEGNSNDAWRGFYSLKVESDAPKTTKTSYTVAFEDRLDATNFCYVLESYFEDLTNARADVIPLSVKELGEAVQSELLKVIVVRKGQLELYAGQPLADVERALRELAK